MVTFLCRKEHAISSRPSLSQIALCKEELRRLVSVLVWALLTWPPLKGHICSWRGVCVKPVAAVPGRTWHRAIDLRPHSDSWGGRREKWRTNGNLGEDEGKKRKACEENRESVRSQQDQADWLSRSAASQRLALISHILFYLHSSVTHAVLVFKWQNAETSWSREERCFGIINLKRLRLRGPSWDGKHS